MAFENLLQKTARVMAARVEDEVVFEDHIREKQNVCLASYLFFFSFFCGIMEYEPCYSWIAKVDLSANSRSYSYGIIRCSSRGSERTEDLVLLLNVSFLPLEMISGAV
jgi:hypothetical protein